MEVQKIQINETRGIIQFGTAIISGINVEFCYNPVADKFTAIAYDKYRACGIFDKGISRDVPQEYLVGRLISKALKTKKMEVQNKAQDVLINYTPAPNEQLVNIEDFVDSLYKVYAVYVNGQYDRRIKVLK